MVFSYMFSSESKFCLDPAVIFRYFNIVKNSHNALHDSEYVSAPIWYFVQDNVNKFSNVLARMCCNFTDLKTGTTFGLKTDERMEKTYQKAIFTEKKQQPYISFFSSAESLICR